MASSHSSRPHRPSRRHSQTSKSYSISPSTSPTSSMASTSPHCYFLPSSVPPSLSITRPEFSRAPASTPTSSAATALLSRVAKSSVSPPGSPQEKMHEKDFGNGEKDRRGDHAMKEVDEYERMEWGEAMRYWQHNHEKRDGYISFPDYDYFVSCGSSNQLDAQQYQHAVRT